MDASSIVHVPACGCNTPRAITLTKWCKNIGVSRVTAYRWRSQKLLKTSINVKGKLFVTREDDAEFWRRAASGEFAKEIRVLKRRGAAGRNANWPTENRRTTDQVDRAYASEQQRPQP